MVRRSFYRIGICAVVAVALFGMQACSEDGDPVGPAQEEWPALPEMSTMTMDLSFFGFAGADAISVKKGAPSEALLAANTERDNWINAVVRALFVQLTIYATFEAPVGAFAVAINSVPQPQSDGSWLWTFIFAEDGIEYSIFLYGMELQTEIDWRMEVSSNDPSFTLDRFVWFDGRSQLDESGGYWQFYYPVLASGPPTAGVPVIRIDWLDAPNGDHLLTILNNEVSGPDEGDTVVLSETATISFIEMTDVSIPEVHNITWLADGSGSITVPDYNNGLIACWDQQGKNTVCP
ncbi:MAG: hypothetical protein O7D32_09400 [bacterium]|nr:hypothetical protein [bacterium]